MKNSTLRYINNCLNQAIHLKGSCMPGLWGCRIHNHIKAKEHVKLV